MYERILDENIQGKIFDHTVGEVYQYWKDRGLLTETDIILSSLPEEDALAVIHSFTTHVHKEKGVFVDLISEEVGISDAPHKALAVSSDLLWALSLMIDDITEGGLFGTKFRKDS